MTDTALAVGLADLVVALDGLPLAEGWFLLLFALFGAFVFLDGFDFGIGMLFAVVDDEERERLLAVIGPIWDGNEVWLVVFGGALFAILGALIARGLAPELYEQRHDAA
jgi:cytochrome d ubiquinol oxidase subunit II